MSDVTDAPANLAVEGVGPHTVDGEFEPVANAAYYQFQRGVDGPIFDIGDAPAEPTEGVTFYGITSGEKGEWETRYDANGWITITNYPNPTTRIDSLRGDFDSDNDVGLDDGDYIPLSGGCVQGQSSAGVPSATRNGCAAALAAAFHGFIKDDETAKDDVLARVMAQVNRGDDPGHNYCENPPWCPDHSSSEGNPFFQLAQVHSVHLQMLDWIGGKERMSASQVSAYDTWLTCWATLYSAQMMSSLDTVITNRSLTNPEQTTVTTTGQDARDEAWDSGPTIRTVGLYFNNRRSSHMRLVMKAGLWLDDQSLIDAAKQYFQEWIMFSWGPDDWAGDFHRGGSGENSSQQGWAYACNDVGHLVTMATTLARVKGDFSLLDFETDHGHNETTDGSTVKSLETVMKGMLRYINREYTSRERNSHPLDPGATRAHDVQLFPANLYYQDEYSDDVMHRDSSVAGIDAPDFPSSPNAATGPRPPWEGEGAMWPDVMMQAALLGTVDPYGVGS